MYDTFVDLLQKRGITPYRISRDTGISQTTFSNWKSGRSTPNSTTMQKIADYLGVSLDYLMTGSDDRFSKENIEIDFALLTDKDLREFIGKYQLLNKDNKKTLKSNMDFMLSEQNKKK